MRLNAFLARAGVASRRGADELIKAGRVTVNGEPGQLNTLVVSTRAIESGSAADDSTYADIESQIDGLTAQRDALATQIRAALNAAASGDAALNEQQAKAWIRQAEDLLAEAAALAS